MFREQQNSKDAVEIRVVSPIFTNIRYVIVNKPTIKRIFEQFRPRDMMDITEIGDQLSMHLMLRAEM